MTNTETMYYPQVDGITPTVIKQEAFDELKSEKFSEWQRVNPLTDSMECSKCGYEIQSEELKTPYCPWCGRKMKNWSDADEDTERDKVCN